jgi:hypothetical protein
MQSIVLGYTTVKSQPRTHQDWTPQKKKKSQSVEGVQASAIFVNDNDN